MTTPSNNPITDPRRIAFLKQQVFSLWNAPVTESSPCPLPVSIQHSNLATLSSEQYVVSAKLDGTRYLLLMTRYSPQFGGQEITVFIDRKWRMFPIYASAKRSVFTGGSLFDGELVNVPIPGVEGRTRQVFFVFDVVCARGQTLCHKAFGERLSVIKGLFFTADDEDNEMMRNPNHWVNVTAPSIVKSRDMIVSNGNAHYLGFRVKGWLPIQQMETILRCGGQMGAPWDGLVFMPLEDPVRTRRHCRMFKWKEKHTIDLIVSDKNELMYYDDILQGNTAAELVTVDGRHLMLVCMDLPIDGSAHGKVVEFQITQVLAPPSATAAFSVFLQYIGIRQDKTNANLTRTVLATIDNVENPVTLPQVMSACGMNNSWGQFQ